MVSDQLVETRRSSQPVMPCRPEHGQGGYDIYPAHDIGANRIVAGHAAIATALGQGTVILDGYPGVFWGRLRDGLTAAWSDAGLESEWIDVSTAMLSGAERATLLEPFTGGDDPVFGTAFTGTLSDLFDLDALAALRASAQAPVRVLYGPGAALAGWQGTLCWVEVPKNEIQFRARAGQPTNLGSDAPATAKVAYKQNYFVDWPAIGRHKRQLLSALDVLIDEQRPEEPTAIRGDDLRPTLDRLTHTQFRARPWFEPGAWGGQWMKNHFVQLPQDAVNYAWSFELISPENGILLESGGLALEVPFDTLLLHDHEAVLGESASRFGPEFPIRFDYLDTYAGGNLSIQVHPSPQYIQEQFGERFTQDETYYILDCEPDAGVYLGFQDGVDPAEFRTALERSAETNEPIDVSRFVQQHPASRHQLFLIPNGTIHGSGTNNLVLEISATPYIFTFKLYDWVRPDLDGLPRPLNIERGLQNVVFERKGAAVAKEFISQPNVVEQGERWRIVHLPTHPDHFYDVRRVELDHGSVEIPTGNSVLVLCVVEGDSVLATTGETSRTYHYAETFVVPAAAECVQLSAPCVAKVVIANVKPGRGPR